ncbi:MAG: hypothetical protein ACI358_07560 [Candidatus Limimorpha sp.]
MRIKSIRSDRGVLVINDYGGRCMAVPLNNRDKLLSFMRSNATNVPLFPMETIDSLSRASSRKVQMKIEAKKIFEEWPYFVIDLNFRYSKSYDISFEEPFFKVSSPFDDGYDFFRAEYQDIESDFIPNGKYKGAHARRYLLDEKMEDLEYLLRENPDLEMEAVIQTTAGEIYTSEKIAVRDISIKTAMIF